jgi:hypothetical protein
MFLLLRAPGSSDGFFGMPWVERSKRHRHARRQDRRRTGGRRLSHILEGFSLILQSALKLLAIPTQQVGFGDNPDYPP